MKQQKILLPLLVFSFASSSFSQELSGTVLQKENKQPLPFVNVILKDTKYGATTDSLGQFAINGFPLGLYVLEVRRLGYRTDRFVLTVDRDEPIRLLVELEVNPIEMQAIEVTSENQKAAQLSALGRTIITSEQIIRSGTKSLATFLKSKYPGVFPSYSRAQYSSLRFVLYVNGVLVQYSGDILDTMFDVEEIDYIEVYRSFGSTPVKSRGSNERVIHIHTKIPPFRQNE